MKLSITQRQYVDKYCTEFYETNREIQKGKLGNCIESFKQSLTFTDLSFMKLAPTR